MANEYLGTNFAAPQKEVGDVVKYKDRQGRVQSGEVWRIQAHFTMRGKSPLIIYTAWYPTYRGNCIHFGEDDLL